MTQVGVFDAEYDTGLIIERGHKPGTCCKKNRKTEI